MVGTAASERLRSHYAKHSAAPSESRRIGAAAKAQNVVALCVAVAHRSVLEIGCGEGSLLACLSELGFADEFYGLDLSPAAVGATRSRGIPRLLDTRAFDGGAVPWQDGRFDLVVLSHVLEHAEHPRQLLYEAARVGRHVFVEVPLEDHWRLPRDFRFDATGHINFYSPAGIRRLVQSCELVVLAERVSNPSRASYVHRAGAAGVVRWGVKEAALRLAPALATRVWTYHGALLCKRSSARSEEQPSEDRPGKRDAR